MTSLLLAFLDRLVSQEAARTNAADASAHLISNRRQLEDVEAYLSHETCPPLRMAGEDHCGVDEKTEGHSSTPQ